MMKMPDGKMMKQCPSCTAMNDGDATVCKNCGGSIG